MLLSLDEIALLSSACSDRTNRKAIELVNLLGTQSGAEMARQIASLPKEMQMEVEKNVREAINEQRRRVRPR
jgi:hypothetical protein